MMKRHKVLTGRGIRGAGAIVVGAMLAGVPIVLAAESDGEQDRSMQSAQQQPAADTTQGQPQDADLLQRRAEEGAGEKALGKDDAELRARDQAAQGRQDQQDQQRIQYGAPDREQSAFTADMQDDGKQATIEGRVINIETYLKHGKDVAIDASDARSRIARGSPVGLLTDDDKVIVLLDDDRGGFFAEPQASSDAQLRDRFAQTERQGALTDSILYQQRASEYNLRAEERLSHAAPQEREQMTYRSTETRIDQQAGLEEPAAAREGKLRTPRGPLHHDPVAQRGPTETRTDRQASAATREGELRRSQGPLHRDPVARRGPAETQAQAEARAPGASIQQAAPQDRTRAQYRADKDKMAKADKAYNRDEMSSRWRQDREQLATVDVDARESKDLIADSSSVSLEAHDRHMRNTAGDGQFTQDQQAVQWGSAEDPSRTAYRADRHRLSLEDQQALQAGNRVSIEGRLYERRDEQGIVPQRIRLTERASQLQPQQQDMSQDRSQTQIQQQPAEAVDTDAEVDVEADVEADVDSDAGM